MIVRHYIYMIVGNDNLVKLGSNPKGGFISELEAYQHLRDILDNSDSEMTLVILKTYSKYTEE